jgi:hypothetical protein
MCVWFLTHSVTRSFWDQCVPKSFTCELERRQSEAAKFHAKLN